MSEKGLDDISLSWDNDKQKMLKWLEMESTTRIRRMIDLSFVICGKLLIL